MEIQYIARILYKDWLLPMNTSQESRIGQDCWL